MLHKLAKTEELTTSIKKLQFEYFFYMCLLNFINDNSKT